MPSRQRPPRAAGPRAAAASSVRSSVKAGGAKLRKTASTARPAKAARTSAARAEAELRAFALGYPEAREEFPWGERVVKVRKKVFVFMGMSDGGLGLSVKLPRTGPMALLLPFAQPTGYGLGKSGWVSARFSPSETPPVGMLREWIDESYRAVAPRKLVAALAAGND
ncbi:MAG TPA: MmcQ/YjbR family DNA-binding protein [Polyangia bacterium]|jgi:predicted DNA-binding protein (MmcQ/YjbR family)|nr:MmcQ/YjbR family DNA-binding protein [Polyangia bacterium]